MAFALGHLLSPHVVACFVSQWIPFGVVWTVLTGIAFLLAGPPAMARLVVRRGRVKRVAGSRQVSGSAPGGAGEWRPPASSG